MLNSELVLNLFRHYVESGGANQALSLCFSSVKGVHSKFFFCALVWNRIQHHLSCWSWVWPSSTCAMLPAPFLGSLAAKKPTSRMWPFEEGRRGAMWLWLHVNMFSSGMFEKERRWGSSVIIAMRQLISRYTSLQILSVLIFILVISVCVGPDPAGSETWGDLSLPFTWWSSYCRGLRRWCSKNLQPAERWEQRLLQRPQVCSQRHTLWCTRGETCYWLKGECGRLFLGFVKCWRVSKLNIKVTTVTRK